MVGGEPRRWRHAVGGGVPMAFTVAAPTGEKKGAASAVVAGLTWAGGGKGFRPSLSRIGFSKF